jgi:hypothetical protein
MPPPWYPNTRRKNGTVCGIVDRYLRRARVSFYVVGSAYSQGRMQARKKKASQIRHAIKISDTGRGRGIARSISTVANQSPLSETAALVPL